MTPPALLRPARALPLAAAVLFGTLTAPAFAQGTAEQREACTPDAVRLCSDTIPDVGKTTACMKRHEAELSPRCHTAFLGVSRPADRHRVARAEPRPRAAAPADGVVAGFPDIAMPNVEMPNVDVPDVDVSAATNRREAREARRVITRLCRNETLDASTCRVAGIALDLAK